MADIVDKLTRSRMMAGIRGKDTRPELLIRKGLHHLGLRYRLHVKDLPGKPDIVFRSHKAVIFIHGCFWHSHECHLFKMPASRQDFWTKKLDRNKMVDKHNIQALLEKSWRVSVVWECALKGKEKQELNHVLSRCYEWLLSEEQFIEITGKK